LAKSEWLFGQRVGNDPVGRKCGYTIDGDLLQNMSVLMRQRASRGDEGRGGRAETARDIGRPTRLIARLGFPAEPLLLK
jgi:hypothetical protein